MRIMAELEYEKEHEMKVFSRLQIFKKGSKIDEFLDFSVFSQKSSQISGTFWASTRMNMYKTYG